MIITTYHVTGMTCDHCVHAIQAEIGRVQDVSGVDVDLATGEVTVRSDHPLDDVAVRAAVDEAGYQVVA
jgi:copper ion binding protein